MRGNLSIRVARASTGREGMHLVDSVPTAHGEVQALVLQMCGTEVLDWRELLRTNALAARIRDQFQVAATGGFHGTFYRSRPFAVGHSPQSSTDLEAPRAGSQLPERYNEDGQRVLYLASSAMVAAIECRTTSDKPRVFIQRFDLDLSHRRIVRLALEMEDRFPHLHYLMLDSEYLPTQAHEFSNVRNPYRATHFVAFLCGLADVSAIEYPSIRAGAQGDRSGFNVAVFGEAVEEAHAQMTGMPQEWSDDSTGNPSA